MDTQNKQETQLNWMRTIDRFVFQDHVSQAIQRDGQRLIDAIKSSDVATMQKLFKKYQRHALDMYSPGAMGAGPGKVFRPNSAKATVGNIADLALRSVNTAQRTPQTEPVASATGEHSDTQLVGSPSLP